MGASSWPLVEKYDTCCFRKDDLGSIHAGVCGSSGWIEWWAVVNDREEDAVIDRERPLPNKLLANIVSNKSFSVVQQ